MSKMKAIPMFTGIIILLATTDAAHDSQIVANPGIVDQEQLSGTPVLESRVCEKLLSSGDLEGSFTGYIAHATHSLNMEALEYIRNRTMVDGQSLLLPVVNPDLLSKEPILGFPPRLGASSFRTFAMNQLDWVLSHSSEEKYDMGPYTPLDRVIHQMHMFEVWTELREAYARADPSPELCSCLEDVNNNGVLKFLQFIALKIREPELMLGRQVNIGRRPPGGWTGNIYRFSWGVDAAAVEGDVLAADEKPMPHLDSPEAWDYWKKLMLSMKGIGADVVTQYIYCMTRSSP